MVPVRALGRSPFDDLMNETIAAIATAPGNGGVGIIRISGSKGISVLETLWEGEVRPTAFENRRIYVGRIAFDQVLAFVMKAPSSYTGEEVVEIQAHGGRRGLELLLETLLKAGAGRLRMANPGEFTQRAFINGRIDLAQAEAVADLISASSEQAVTLAGRQLEGRLSEYVGKLRNEIKVMRAQMEAMIDFPEDEDVQGLRYEEVLERLQSIEARIRNLLTTYEEGRYLRDGIRVALVGKPNVGKSSLFNALLNDDRSIVHPTPGTTRDTVEEVLDFGGLSVRFIDTAGIREGRDAIEGEGIQRSQRKIDQSDLILFLCDVSRPWEEADERIRALTAERRTVLVANKSDLPPAFDPPFPTVRVSAKTGQGLAELKEAIRRPFLGRESRAQDPGVTLSNLRHRVALEKGLEALNSVAEGAREKRSLELLAADLSLAMNRLGEITGEVTNDEILGEIFSKFCIGK